MNILNTFKKRLSFKKPLASILFIVALLIIIVYYFNKDIFTNMNVENFENDGKKKVVYFYMNVVLIVIRFLLYGMSLKKLLRYLLIK